MSERRTGWLLLALLAAQLALLASGVPAEDGDGSLLEAAGLRLVSPLARLTSASGRALGGLQERLQGRRTLLAENRRLAGRVEQLQLELSRLRGVEEEARRLAAAIDYVRSAPGPRRLVNVVYLDRTSWLRTLIVFAGGEEVEVHQPVLTSEGLVGRVIQVAGPYARVQLITDTAAAVGAIVERTGRQGLIQGTGGELLELLYLPQQADVAVGDRVVTAGIDGVYPPGLVIGTVIEVEPGDELFHRIRVSPAVDLGRRQRHVYLLGRRELPEELREPPQREVASGEVP